MHFYWSSVHRMMKEILTRVNYFSFSLFIMTRVYSLCLSHTYLWCCFCNNWHHWSWKKQDIPESRHYDFIWLYLSSTLNAASFFQILHLTYIFLYMRYVIYISTNKILIYYSILYLNQRFFRSLECLLFCFGLFFSYEIPFTRFLL